MEEFLNTLYKIEHSVRILRLKETTRLENSPKVKPEKEAIDLAREISKNVGLLAILLDGRRDALAIRKK